MDLQPDHDKAYRAEVRFGLATDTGDVTGTPVAAGENIPGAAAVEQALAAFLGPQMQTPPMYSAVKVGGRAPLQAGPPGQDGGAGGAARHLLPAGAGGTDRPGPVRHRHRVQQGHLCGAPWWKTWGAALGCPACLAALRRTRAGAFTLEGCVTLEAIQAAKEAGELEKLLAGVDTVFTHLPAAEVSEKETARLLNGAPVRRAEMAEGRWRLYAGGAFLGLGKAGDGVLRAEKLFVERA